MPREKIVRDFAEWAAFSSTRSGCPIKSREAVYPLIRKPNYGEIFDGDLITQEEFGRWHEINTMAICQADSRLPIGWAVKLINIYLKTRVYIARDGRDGLIKCIHPPIDNGLWNGIMGEYGNEPVIINKTHCVLKIKDIITYDIYEIIIEGCRLIAEMRRCHLIEVEELWQGTMI